MVTLVPNSGGSYEPDALIEFNPCHDPKTGKFSSNKAGRCSEYADRTMRRVSTEAVLGDGELSRIARIRRDARRAEKSLPGYLQQELPKFRKERATLVQTPEDGMSPLSPRIIRNATSFAPFRLAIMNLHALKGNTSKTDILTIARHELGHVSPQAFGKIARIVGFNPKAEAEALAKRLQKNYDGDLDYATAHAQASRAVDTYIEELRAWRNAVRDSGGRVKWSTAQRALSSYLQVDLEKSEHHAARDAFHHIRGLKRYANALRRRKKAA